jgi:hypothetical protein
MKVSNSVKPNGQYIYNQFFFSQLYHASAATPPNQLQRCILTDYFNNYNFSKLK